MLHQGRLKDWNPTQGRGLIQRDKAGPDIRVCSSGFRKKPEQLQNGDRIFFQIEVDSTGQLKAVGAYKAGQHFAPAPELKKPRLSSLPFQRLLSGLVSLSILAWLGYQSVYLFGAQASLPAITAEDESAEEHKATVLSDSPVWPPIQTQSYTQFQCEGKQYCTQMQSCEEAEFYLTNCPDVMIDGDSDGIPCEQQHCSRSRF
ncbi:MAG: excalibur calcium-binding domain-containing protein [Pararheinheimera sp.]|nr:excalibur calcium-binding domain-containing protein [Rheinheimera sp.]